MIIKSSSVEIQNRFESQITTTLSRTLKNINFYLSTFPAKIKDKFFYNKEKNLFWGSLLPKENFP